MEIHLATTHLAQLLGCAFVGTGLGQGLAIKLWNLIGANHDGAGVKLGNRLRLGAGQTQAQVIRRFAGQRGFIHFRGDCFKWQLQAAEQLTSIARGGAEDQWTHESSGNQGFGHGGILLHWLHEQGLFCDPS